MEITRKRDMGSLTFERELGVDDHLTDRERVREKQNTKLEVSTTQRSIDLMKAQIETKTNFGEVEMQRREFQTFFKFFDDSKAGQLTLQDFSDAMVKLNFVGCERDIKELFDEFAEDNLLDYNAMSLCIWPKRHLPMLGKAERAF